MDFSAETLLEAWAVVAAIAAEIWSTFPGTVAGALLGGIGAGITLEILRRQLWGRFCLNRAYEPGLSDAVVGLVGGIAVLGAVVGGVVLREVDFATENWRQRERANLAEEAGWLWESFQRLFAEVRISELEDLSSVPDPSSHGGDRLPLTRPESWQLAVEFYRDQAWQRLRLRNHLLEKVWREAPPVSQVPFQPGVVTPNPLENPPLFDAIDLVTRYGAERASNWVKGRAGLFRTSLLFSALVAQVVSWALLTWTACRDIRME